jgi:hypothetical protein
VQSLTNRTIYSPYQFFLELTALFFNYIAFIEQLFELALRMPYSLKADNRSGETVPRNFVAAARLSGRLWVRATWKVSAEFDFPRFLQRSSN